MGWTWGKTRYQLLSYLLPAGYGLLTYSFVWLIGLGGIKADFSTNLLLLLTAGLLQSCVFALGEEIGWRGFLVPELTKRFSFTKTSLVSGLIWAVWHYPLLLFADYNSGTPAWYGVTCFTIMTVGLAFAFTWLRLKSGSVWTAMFLHASHNLYIQGVFDRMTTDTGMTKYITGEFGVALALAAGIIAAVFWRLRGRLVLR